MKYEIELEPIAGTNLFKAKGFNTLVFDSTGIAKLKPVESDLKPHTGDVVKTINGTTLYEFRGYVDDNKYANCINLNTSKYVCMPANNLVVVERAYEQFEF